MHYIQFDHPSFAKIWRIEHHMKSYLSSFLVQFQKQAQNFW